MAHGPFITFQLKTKSLIFIYYVKEWPVAVFYDMNLLSRVASAILECRKLEFLKGFVQLGKQSLNLSDCKNQAK